MSDHERYTRRNILRAERMYGEGFQSPGQVEAVESGCAQLALRPGMRVLDVNTGIGCLGWRSKRWAASRPSMT